MLPVNRPNEGVNRIWQAAEVRGVENDVDAMLYKGTIVKKLRTAYFATKLPAA
jgi:hypothetical protein